MKSPCLVEGHRGAPFLAVENTLDGFRAAYESGAGSVELDVFLLSDGSLAIFHGGDGGELSKLTHGKGPITELTLEEVQKIKFNADCEDIVVDCELSEKARIPSLQEALAVVKEKEDRRVTVELKGPNTAGGSLAVVKEMGLLNRTVFSSFKHDLIARVKELEPNATTAALFEKKVSAEELIEGARKVGADQIHYRYDFLSKELVDTLKLEKFTVMGWMRGPKTMKGEETIELYREVMAYGIDTICVNHPEFFGRDEEGENTQQP